MPYISKQQVQEIRERFKEEFPAFKFSVSKDRYSSTLSIKILQGDIDFISRERALLEEEIKRGQNLQDVYDYRKKCLSDNYFYVNDKHIDADYQDDELLKDIFNKICFTANKGNGVLVEDSDYGTVPYFYFDLSVGTSEKPYILKV